MADKKKSKKPSKTVLGANLRSWRKAYGLSLEDVAEALEIGRSTVAAYEAGTREVPDKILYKYADYLAVPIEALLKGKPFSIKANVDPTIIMKHIDVFFPIEVCEIDNVHYQRACKMHREMYELLKLGIDNALLKFEDCRDEYFEAMQDSSVEYAAAANTIALLYLNATMAINTIEIIKMRPAVLRQYALRNKAFADFYDDPDPEMIQGLQEEKELMRDPDITEFKLDVLRALKQKREWYELADYYIAAQYFFNIVDNAKEMKTNWFIGVEMLDVLESVGNRYAKKVNRTLIEWITQKSLHTVDDK